MCVEQANGYTIIEQLPPAISGEVQTSLRFGGGVICLCRFLKRNKPSVKKSYLAPWMYVPCVPARHKPVYSNSGSRSPPQITGPVPLRADREAVPSL